MICPDCEAQTHVVESRAAADGAAVRRRRECTS
ncbi:MAG: transcriptional regulator NrdR, partial [Actinomycetota bacterium]|nr:transcriptional regulator NrdR [Actinomycetota bacterium]